MNDWQGTVVILASGPSLTEAQCEHVRDWHQSGGGRVIAINHTHRRAPWADVLYACDGSWWRYHYAEVRRVFKGQLWTQDAHAAKTYNIHHIVSERGVGLSRDPKVIYQGGGVRGAGNSGYQAMNLAFHWGVKRIVLLGYDMKICDGKKNWHEPHVLATVSPYESWVRNYIPLAVDLDAEGVTVVNATPGTALDCFQKVRIEEALGARTVLAA